MTRLLSFADRVHLSRVYFIPDPDLAIADQTRISGASGVAADASDTILYGADVAPRQLRRYIRALGYG